VASEQSNALSGKKFLYQKPELLSAEDHAALGLTPSQRPFDHVRAVRGIPLNLGEFTEAHLHYPIVFASKEQPTPVAIVGVTDDDNLFVNDAGLWDPLAYVPGYLRCYPFSVASSDGSNYALVVDVAAPTVSDQPAFPFFVDGAPSEATQTMMQMCAEYERGRMATEQFGKQLISLDLLSTHRTTHTPEGESEAQTLADYVAVNAERLAELPQETVYELHRSGALAALHLHLASLQNWRRLLARRALRDGGGGQGLPGGGVPAEEPPTAG
jgi:hypothetical protein